MLRKTILLLAIVTSTIHAETTCTEPPDFAHQYPASIDTIGDSITAVLDGTKMRCILNAHGLNLNYIGQYVDPYGYRHDGRSGDTTVQVLERMNTIPKSDNYFVLIGVNDKAIPDFTAEKTAANIEAIAEQLYEKNIYAHIFISTLLPTIREDLNAQNSKVNDILRAKLNCHNCILVDTGDMFSKLKDWQSYTLDEIHPNAKGYEAIADYVVPIIKNHVYR